ncbi:GyrI-like domain-containing protein [Companilactobacillus sp. DQM5]|uniref:GyrI-like domain-containing protein n=1 Tax=Companilactobacillus sp. DQM5 TaxID=3463359 RepID=UPI004057DC53
MKYEWRKNEKDIYLPKGVVKLDLPEYNYITLEGTGNPNSEDFSEHIQALYPIAYGIRMALKKGELGEPFEYTVYPLEGIWTTSDGSRDEYLNKDALVYKIMIRQPEIVTEELFNDIKKNVLEKKENKYFSEVTFEKITDGKVVEALHNGPFETEINTFQKMEEFMKENNLEKTTFQNIYQHREIYLSDNRRTAPEKLKTVLRYKLK